MATIGMFREDRPHLDYIEGLWAQLDKIDVDLSPNDVAPPASDFGRDLAALPTFSGYNDALELVGSALEHLQCLREYSGNDPYYKHWRLKPSWTLLRAAHEMASEAVWLASPTDQRSRIERLLQFNADDIKNHISTQKVVSSYPADFDSWENATQLLQGFDTAAAPWYVDDKTKNRIKNNFSITDCVKVAAIETKILKPEMVQSFWKAGSAYAHGKNWANHYAAELIDLGDGTKGWKPNYQVLALYITTVMNTAIYALHLVHIRCGFKHRYKPAGTLTYTPPSGP